MISLTSEYALQAMIHLAQHVEDWPIAGRRIAEETGVPGKYLGAILRDLVRVRVLQSSPGAGGGFRLARSAKKIRLSEVFAPFEPILGKRRPCPFGQEVCSDEDPCAGHDEWKRVRDTYGRFLEKNSIHDVAFARRKRRAAQAPRRTKR
ncbi:MAG: Rrf2 family transcriptional regulator [Planctomycetes bacterium]|nr:Rrf2 family transcriptional regulator [Planctomycetota bacterium]